MVALKETGEEGFLAGLRRFACSPLKRNGAVVFSVTPVGGRYAGQSVQTGVSVSELTSWPTVPPHWVHLPDSVTFSRTNSRPSPLAGWRMHSRSLNRWGNAEEPIRAWLAHVRAVLEEA